MELDQAAHRLVNVRVQRCSAATPRCMQLACVHWSTCWFRGLRHSHNCVGGTLERFLGQLPVPVPWWCSTTGDGTGKVPRTKFRNYHHCGEISRTYMSEPRKNMSKIKNDVKFLLWCKAFTPACPIPRQLTASCYFGTGQIRRIRRRTLWQDLASFNWCSVTVIFCFSCCAVQFLAAFFCFCAHRLVMDTGTGSMVKFRFHRVWFNAHW